jgi:hypothetical protein
MANEDAGQLEILFEEEKERVVNLSAQKSKLEGDYMRKM